MSIDLTALLDQAFFAEDVQNASLSVDRALTEYEQQTHVGGRPFEVVAPAEPDERWLRDRLVRGLVYYCESEGAPPPKCSGTVVALFVGKRLYGIAAQNVITWATGVLGASIEQLRAEYGTHEQDAAPR